MDSKNLIWLSSFFSLLFITFCVTRHLDDLNPQITSIPHERQEVSAELAAVNLEEDTQSFIAQNIETPNIETPNILKEKTEVFTSDKLTVDLPKIEKPKARKEPIMIKKPVVIQKPKSVKKPKIIITKTEKPTKAYTIGGIHLDSFAMQEIYSHKNSNELNKLAYMHSINKNSTIVISTDDKNAVNRLKEYLQKQNVKKQHIKTVSNGNENNLIKITLIGRK